MLYMYQEACIKLASKLSRKNRVGRKKIFQVCVVLNKKIYFR